MNPVPKKFYLIRLYGMIKVYAKTMNKKQDVNMKIY